MRIRRARATAAATAICGVSTWRKPSRCQSIATPTNNRAGKQLGGPTHRRRSTVCLLVSRHHTHCRTRSGTNLTHQMQVGAKAAGLPRCHSESRSTLNRMCSARCTDHTGRSTCRGRSSCSWTWESSTGWSVHRCCSTLAPYSEESASAGGGGGAESMARVAIQRSTAPLRELSSDRHCDACTWSSRSKPPQKLLPATASRRASTSTASPVQAASIALACTVGAVSGWRGMVG